MWLKDKEKRAKYYEKTKNRKLSPLLIKVLKLGNFRTALDLGSGAGADAKDMAAIGLNVTAVDVNPETEKFFHCRKNIKLKICSFENFKFGKYDLIYSKSSLVFMSSESFDVIMEKIKKSLNKNGFIAIRLWGKNDSSNKPGINWTFVSKEEIKKYFADFQIFELEEKEFDGTTALGKPKHWHIIDLIAKKIKK